MEEKKIDKNSILGFILIGAILVWLIYTQPSSQPQEDDNNTEIESVASDSLEPESNPIKVSRQMIKPPRQNEQIALENSLIKMNISTKGGQVNEVLIKNQKSHTGEPVYLIKDGNSNFNIKLYQKDGLVINTRDLLFSKRLSKSGTNTVLSLRHTFEAGQSLEFQYTIKDSNYLVDFDVKSTGLGSVIDTGKSPSLRWEMKAFRHAKSVIYENRYTMLAYHYEGDKVDELSASGEDEEIEKQVRWIAFRQHFFNAILVNDNVFSEATLKSNNLVDDEGEDVLFTKQFLAETSLNFSNGDLQEHLHWYYGTTDYKTLTDYDEPFELSQSLYLGWGIFGWLNKYIFIPLFEFLCSIVPHGIAIILLTILVRLVMSPATYKSYLSQAKMRVLHPEISEINKKYEGKDNAVKRQQETMALYRKAGVNPMSGCIPALMQLPVFYALFTFFPTAFVLRQKEFLWAKDLSSYDTIFQLPFSIPFYGSHVSLFPLLASIAIFFYMRMTSGQTMQQQQQPGMPNMKFLLYLSPIMMLFFFNNYASGLSLYYFISNLITIVIMLVIKNVIIDEEKIHMKIQENKKKPKTMNRFQRKMQDMMDQAEAQKRKK